MILKLSLTVLLLYYNTPLRHARDGVPQGA